MSTNQQTDKRITKQVRISAYWHKRLKIEAAHQECTISHLLDDLCKAYFEEREPICDEDDY